MKPQDEYIACKFDASRKCSRVLFELFECRACQVPAEVVAEVMNDSLGVRKTR